MPPMSRSDTDASSSGSSCFDRYSSSADVSVAKFVYSYEGIPDDCMDSSSYDETSERMLDMLVSRRSSCCCDPFYEPVIQPVTPPSPPQELQDMADANSDSDDSASTLSQRSSCTLEGRQALSLTRRMSEESVCPSQLSRSLPNTRLSFRHLKKSLQLLRPRLGSHRTSTVVETPSHYLFGSASVRYASSNADLTDRTSFATSRFAWNDYDVSTDSAVPRPSGSHNVHMRATDSPTPSMWSQASSQLSSGPTCLVDRLDGRARVRNYQRGLRKQMYPPRVRYSQNAYGDSSSTIVPVLGQPF